MGPTSRYGSHPTFGDAMPTAPGRDSTSLTTTSSEPAREHDQLMRDTLVPAWLKPSSSAPSVPPSPPRQAHILPKDDRDLAASRFPVPKQETPTGQSGPFMRDTLLPRWI